MAILGLSGLQPMYLSAVGGVVLGLAFLMQGAIDYIWTRMVPFLEHQSPAERIVPFSGMVAEAIAGCVAIVSSILSFAFVGEVRFGAVTVMALGMALLSHGGIMQRVSKVVHHVAFGGTEDRCPTGPFALNVLTLAPVRDFLIGLGGVVLGVLAIMKIAPVALTFVALLTMGGALAATASTMCGAALTTVRGVCAKSES